MAFMLLLWIAVSTAVAQQSYPPELYQAIRSRLTERYLRVGDCHGCSIPASWYDSVRQQLVYEDESPRQIGWYLAVLATEQALLKKNNLPSVHTEKELYYALQALNRLDNVAEFFYCTSPGSIGWDNEQQHYYRINSSGCGNEAPSDNLNGFMIREDVPPGWHEQFPGDKPVRHGDGHSNWIVGDKISRHPNPFSQDQLYHVFFGLAFVTRFVDDSTLYDGVPLRKEARQIAARMMQIFSPDYKIIHPVTGIPLSATIGGNAGIYAFPLAVAADFIVNGTVYPTARNRQNTINTQNPYFTTQSGISAALWKNFLSALWLGNSQASPNQVMTLLLVTISNAFNGWPDNKTIRFFRSVSSYINPDYRLFGNAFSLLHGSTANTGYSKEEMEYLLAQMDTKGPHRYSDQYCNVKQNPVWNRDCIFVQPPIPACRDKAFEGHFNGLDYLLLQNIYLLQHVYEEKTSSGGMTADSSYGAKIELYPNPVGNELFISVSTKKATHLAVTITDMSGRQVFSTGPFIPAGQSSVINIPLPGLAAGLYYCQVQTAGSRQLFKLVKS